MVCDAGFESSTSVWIKNINCSSVLSAHIQSIMSYTVVLSVVIVVMDPSPSLWSFFLCWRLGQAVLLWITQLCTWRVKKSPQSSCFYNASEGVNVLSWSTVLSSGSHAYVSVLFSWRSLEKSGNVFAVSCHSVLALFILAKHMLTLLASFESWYSVIIIVKSKYNSNKVNIICKKKKKKEKKVFIVQL